ncbi:MAG: hypothetical protein U0559_00380 [Anaerolineae bacterium]
MTNQSTSTSTPTTKRTLSLIFFIMLMDIVGLTILFPVAPYIVRRFSQWKKEKKERGGERERERGRMGRARAGGSERRARARAG